MGSTHCKAYKKCGGCQLDVTYPQQLSCKQRLTDKLLGKFGRVEPILGMDDPLRYRCKVSTAFGFSRGRPISGVWQASSGRLVTTENCILEDERAARIVSTIKRLLPVFKLRTYDERSGVGFLRFVTIRIGKRTGQILVALGTGAGKFPGKKDFVQALVKQYPEITTVVQNISTDRLNLILGEKETVLYGNGTVIDTLCGYDFQMSARSFFQVNPTQTEHLYSTAIDFAGLSGKETVIDAYCGVGTIGIIASEKAGSVISVESNEDAVKNALGNAALNKVKNISIVRGDAGAFMSDIATRDETVDVVFTDPPRAGCSRKFLLSLVSLSPKKVVYISCSIETLERDLKFLTKNGYSVKRIRPVDMFPYTRHVECCVLLEKA